MSRVRNFDQHVVHENPRACAAFGGALRIALRARNNSQPQSVLRCCVLSGQIFFCVRVFFVVQVCVALRSVIAVAGKFASILICGLAA